MKVLIADDSKIIRDRITKLLSGYKEIEAIDETKNVRETIRKIRSSYPNVLILDVKMPDGNGIEVLNSIAHDKFPPIVIVVTNYPFPEYEKEYMLAGADFFFDKSSEFRLMQKVIENLVDNEIRIKTIKRNESEGQNNKTN